MPRYKVRPLGLVLVRVVVVDLEELGEAGGRPVWSRYYDFSYGRSLDRSFAVECFKVRKLHKNVTLWCPS